MKTRLSAIAFLAVLAAVAAGSSSAASHVRPCHAVVDHGVLPSWARTGFSGPRPKLPHTLSRGGQLAALIFGYPLVAPPAPAAKRANKILWVSRAPLKLGGGDLRLRAQRMRGTRRVGRVVVRVVAGGPGPSIIDLPAPGCWRVDARWSGHRDVVDLRYR